MSIYKEFEDELSRTFNEKISNVLSTLPISTVITEAYRETKPKFMLTPCDKMFLFLTKKCPESEWKVSIMHDKDLTSEKLSKSFTTISVRIPKE